MERPHPIADPIPGHPIELKMTEFAGAPHVTARPANVCDELDRYDIAVVLQPVYEWGGFRYTNAAEAIAAAERASK